MPTNVSFFIILNILRKDIPCQNYAVKVTEVTDTVQRYRLQQLTVNNFIHLDGSK